MAHQLYENFVLENKIKNMLDTKLAVNPFMTIDYSLTEAAGRKKTIAVYNATGTVKDVAQGEGNDSGNGIAVTRTSKDYEVKYTQGFVSYFDEEIEKDPMLMDTSLEKSTALMANDMTKKFYAELGKTTNTAEYQAATGITFNDVVDAIATFGEDEEGLFMLISPSMKAKIRKNLKDELKYVEGFVRTGYIGSICGVPVYTSKVVPEQEAYIATKEAVTCFVKKEISSEQERDANLRKNTLYFRRENVVALTDESKAFKFTQAVAAA